MPNVIKVKLTYVQYRLSADGNRAVPEKKETYFEGTFTEIAAAGDQFLTQGAVVRDGKTYYRSPISAEEVLRLPPVLEPDRALLPLGDEFPS